MEYLEPAVEKADELAVNIPELVKVCNKHGIRPGHVLLVAGSVSLVLLVIIQGYGIICSLLTCVYPMVMSIQAIESVEKEADKIRSKWLCFWCVFGIFQVIEMFLGTILGFIPYYAYIRLAFFVFMMAPQTDGAEKFYLAVAKPFFVKHQD